MPAPGTLVLWRSIYVHDGAMYADGVRTPYVGETLVRPGTSHPLAAFEGGTAEAERVFDAFAWFSDGFVGVVESESPRVVADMRYSTESHDFAPLWGIRYGAEGPDNWSTTGRDGYAGRLLRLLLDGDPAWHPLRELRSVGPSGQKTQAVEHDEHGAALVPEDAEDQRE